MTGWSLVPGWLVTGGLRFSWVPYFWTRRFLQTNNSSNHRDILLAVQEMSCLCSLMLENLVSVREVSKGAKIRNRYNRVPYLTQDTNGKVTNSQLDTTSESQEVSPFPAGDHKAHINRHAQRHSKHKKEKNPFKIHKRSTALERSVKYFTGGLKPV